LGGITAGGATGAAVNLAALGVNDGVGMNDATYATNNVSAKMATLVADGVSPTQAHVTALNTSYTTFKAGIV
jgi:hypothetical protein